MTPGAPAWHSPEDCRIEDFAALVERETAPADHPLAARIESGVPVYECAALRARLAGSAEPAAERRALQAEWHRAFADGPGIVVLAGAFPDAAVVDATSAVFRRLIEAERAHGRGGDHFAKPGANDRLWNAQQKLCLQAPEVFAAYYANDMIDAVSEAWLGPAYQMTAQVNVVNPGGEAQQPHRDYHLGFMTPEAAARYPSAVHALSPLLTLQGAVAHCDMPVETGPTLYLPHSQRYRPGYLAWAQPAFRDYFQAHHVQLPLAKGDAVFFNPALFHAAGSNRTADVRRMANLLQVSSAFGRAMETLDRVAMCRSLYPALQRLLEDGRLDADGGRRAVACCAEGYAFPTNLDRDPPLGGLAPPSQQDLMNEALRDGWSMARFEEGLDAQAARRVG